MKRIVVWYSIMSLLLGIMGCGSDNESESDDNTPQPQPKDTYLNTKFLVKIANMPIDTWTVKKFGKDEQGLMLNSEPGLYSSYILFLMEPVPSNKPNQFIDYDEVIGIDSLMNAGMPFIDVWVVKYDDIEIPSYKLPEIIKSMYADIELSEAKPIAGTNCTGYKITSQFDSDNKITLSYFVKKDILVLIEYIAQNTKYDTYVGVNDNIVKNLTLMGM